MYRTKFCTITGDVCQANLDAPVDVTTAQSNDDEVSEARTDLTRRDPVHWSPSGKDLVTDVRKLICQRSTAAFQEMKDEV